MVNLITTNNNYKLYYSYFSTITQMIPIIGEIISLAKTILLERRLTAVIKNNDPNKYILLNEIISEREKWNTKNCALFYFRNSSLLTASLVLFPYTILLCISIGFIFLNCMVTKIMQRRNNNLLKNFSIVKINGAVKR